MRALPLNSVRIWKPIARFPSKTGSCRWDTICSIRRNGAFVRLCARFAFNRINAAAVAKGALGIGFVRTTEAIADKGGICPARRVQVPGNFKEGNVLRPVARFCQRSAFVETLVAGAIDASAADREAPERPVASTEIELDELEPLADWPEFMHVENRELALAFAWARHADFEAVAWLNGVRRGRVGLLGDVAQALGLRLEGPWDDNVRALNEYCAEHRVLLAFENLEPGMAEFVNFVGKASVIAVEAQMCRQSDRSPNCSNCFRLGSGMRKNVWRL